NDKIVVSDLARNTTTRLTNTPGNDAFPVWSPDGTMIAYRNDRSGSIDLFVIPTDGSEPGRPVLTSPLHEYAASWSHDGTEIVYTREEPDGHAETWVVPVDGSADPRKLVDVPFSTWSAVVSPDGKWVAYTSDSAGEDNVFVAPFLGQGKPVRISRGEGDLAHWSSDGNTLYYVSDDTIMSVTYVSNDKFEVSAPQELTQLEESFFGSLTLSPESERFLVSRGNPELNKHYVIRVVPNWANGLTE
ncbi:MAG: Tol biopolymer transport system component, partial [Candidatus Krumholzibacteriia bacterium]